MAERTQLETFDQRIIEFQIRSGNLSKKDYERYLKSLPNDEDNVDYIEVFEEEASSSAVNMPELTFVAAESNE